ncbi:hypothetical protein [Rheinheimera pleomorphica]|uniref:hypothetical protein n=1 Tax=Rheinheimera pleomorphica TaxID=2703963 RepID=UPI001420A438|nr:hypothetical protein [Rheinheimera pleomorphica]
MKNPVYYEYRRTAVFGTVLLLLLASLGATLHYLRSVEARVTQTKQRLLAVSNQLDAEFAPVLAFGEAVRRAALAKLTLTLQAVPNETLLPLLQLNSGQTVQVRVVAADGTTQPELMMLYQLQPYFELAQQAQPHLVGMYYISEQGFVYNGQPKWSDYIADQLLQWHENTGTEPSYERELVFYSEFLSQQAAVSLPLYADDKKLGRFVFALALQPMLAPMYQQHANTEFMLLDQSGEVISSSTSSALQSINEHLLQIQRLRTMPWSLGLLEQKTSLFAAGLADFIWHWLSYATLMLLLLLALQYRYRRRTLSPLNRLLIHIDRLEQGQLQGVRHVPSGWAEVFDKIARLVKLTKTSE